MSALPFKGNLREQSTVHLSRVATVEHDSGRHRQFRQGEGTATSWVCRDVGVEAFSRRSV